MRVAYDSVADLHIVMRAIVNGADDLARFLVVAHIQPSSDARPRLTALRRSWLST
jgi:hypothetical protein